MKPFLPPHDGPPPPLTDYAPSPGAPEVIYSDDHLLAVIKPAGLLSVPGRGPALADCLEARVRRAFPAALRVHRLDMATSGVMILALNRAAQRHLGLQFERRQVRKTYAAAVWGEVEAEGGEIDLPLIIDWPNRPLQKVCHATGRRAVTAWSVRARDPGVTRLELRPETGRSHQLRVHMAAMGHPILGDEFYAHAAARAASPRLELYAERLELRHPVGGAPMRFEAPVF
jgi:tRNA pseudouridine32 synthase/23S rRNA pseudouridine746 synthase